MKKEEVLKEINLEYQWRQYLKRVDLVESQLHPKQRTEMKRAFYGARGQMLVLWLNSAAILDDEEFVLTMQNIKLQIQSFFDGEVKKGGH